MHHHHGKQAITRARELRSHTTEAERALWHKIREFKQIGYHFRRQSPFRMYVLDFVEHGAKLVVELDGNQHGLPERSQRDERRDALLHSEGYLVLRFWNSEIAENFDGIVDHILRELQQRSPTRSASRIDHPTEGEVKKSARPLPRKGLRRLV